MTRKTNVETVPGGFQKTQVTDQVLCIKPGIFEPDAVVPRSGLTSLNAAPQQGLLRTEQALVFAYGSLIWRPNFSYRSRQRAVLSGFRRSFRQASTDHRGTPQRPGRVVTLVPSPEHRTVGVVYELEAPPERTLAELDHRERAGYERVTLQVRLDDGASAAAITWVASPGNPHDAGELELDALLEVVAGAAGPSGRNDQYVYELEKALCELAGTDTLVSELAHGLRSRLAQGGAAGEPFLASGPPERTT